MEKEEIKQVDLSAVNKIIDSTFYETQKLISYDVAFHREKLKKYVDMKAYHDASYHMVKIGEGQISRIEIRRLYDTLKNRIDYKGE